MRRPGSLVFAKTLAFAGALVLVSCSSDNALVLADAAHDAEAARAAHDQRVERTNDLHEAVEALCAAAPLPAPDGWVKARDGASIEAMKSAWKDARRAYSSIEGAMSLVSPEFGPALDGRYEQALQAGPDPELFDSQGFVGLHAIERILWADRIPPSMVMLEAKLVGYVPAAFPADEAEAKRFRDGLCARLTNDTRVLEAQIGALPLDSSAAYAETMRLVAVQADKLLQAGERHEPSRYASYTLAELGENLAAAKASHSVFRPWLLTKPSGPSIDKKIMDAFERLEKEYAAFGSDALPYLPMDWSNSALSNEALGTPFGLLFAAVSNEANVSLDGSLARSMAEAAVLLGIDTIDSIDSN